MVPSASPRSPSLWKGTTATYSTLEGEPSVAGNVVVSETRTRRQFVHCRPVDLTPRGTRTRKDESLACRIGQPQFMSAFHLPPNTYQPVPAGPFKESTRSPTYWSLATNDLGYVAM